MSEMSIWDISRHLSCFGGWRITSHRFITLCWPGQGSFILARASAMHFWAPWTCLKRGSTVKTVKFSWKKIKSFDLDRGCSNPKDQLCCWVLCKASVTVISDGEHFNHSQHIAENHLGAFVGVARPCKTYQLWKQEWQCQPLQVAHHALLHWETAFAGSDLYAEWGAGHDCVLPMHIATPEGDPNFRSIWRGCLWIWSVQRIDFLSTPVL